MNWLDFNFWFFGPLPIWILAVAVFTLSFAVFLLCRIIKSLSQSFVPELDKVMAATREDTNQLTTTTHKLYLMLESVRDNTAELNKTIIQWFNMIKPWWVNGIKK